MPTRAFVLIFLLALPGLGCKKAPSNQITYHLINSTVPYMRIKLDMYASKKDYAAETDRISTYMVDSTIEVQLDEGKTYWIDWYTTGGNYTYDNWWRGTVKDSSDITLIGGKSPTNVIIGGNPDNNDTARSVILNNGIYSVWEGTAANLDSNYKGFDSLNGKHQFVFNKDKSCVHTVWSKYGKMVDSCSFATLNIRPYARLAVSFDRLFGANMFGCIGNYDRFFGATMSRDSMAVFVESETQHQIAPTFYIIRK